MKRKILAVLGMSLLIFGIRGQALFADEQLPYSIETQVQNQEISSGDTINVDIVVSSDNYSTFHAIDITITYDPEVLSWQEENSTGLDGYLVVAESGQINIVGYGETKSVGTVFTLAFAENGSMVNGEKTQIQITRAYIDIGASAVSADAREAARKNEGVITLTKGEEAVTPTEPTEEDTKPSSTEETESTASTEETTASETKETSTQSGETKTEEAAETTTAADDQEITFSESEEAATDAGESVKTGDTSGFTFWLIIGLAALLGFLLLGYQGRREK